MFAKLLVIAGPDRGKRFEVVPAVPMVIGRGRDSDARLSDPRVSPVHAKLVVRNATLFVMDMDSLTGTSVNNVFVSVEYPLQLGDTFTLGDTVVLVQDPDAPDPPEVTAPKNAGVARPESAKGVEDADKPRPSRTQGVPPPKSAPPGVKPQVAPPKPEPKSAVMASSGNLPDRPEQLTGHELSHYHVGPLLSRGRTGFVFNAQDMKHQRPVALKVMTAAYAQDDHNRAQFTKAMKLALPLRHPNVVPVLGVGKTGPYCWVAMELVNGESLTATVRHVGVAGSLDWRRALKMSIYLARGLTYVHEQHVVYRNVGPQNVLCEGDARMPRLSDFLRARPFFDPIDPGHHEEMPDSLMLYASPEQTREETEIDHRSDIFNLGALCYSLVTGRPPFEGGSLAETITKIRREKPEDPKKYQLAIPKAFEGVILQMLAKRPEDRYQTTAEVLRDLERVLKYQGMTL
jgi:pSer/pThr/pTyr-binding forkhead associated (FHA) protein